MSEHLEAKLEKRAVRLMHIKPIFQAITRVVLLLLVGLSIKTSCDWLTGEVARQQTEERSR